MQQIATPATNAIALPRTRDARRRAAADSRGLLFVRRAGLIVFAAQLVALLIWSSVEASRLVQTGGFVGFYQSWYLIAHGHLGANGWWRSQGVLVQYPLALLALFSESPFVLLAVQDLAIVGAEVVAFLWICDLIAERADLPRTGYCLTGLALLALDPWIYWSASWDYHSEALGTLFAILAARELRRGRRIAALWCALTLLSGMVPATYLLGIGAGLLFARRRRLAGAVVAGGGLAWFSALTALGAGKGLGYVTPGQTRYSGGAPLGTVTGRIAEAGQMLGHHWIDLFINLMPAGFVGALIEPALGIVAVVLGENLSEGSTTFLIPSFQSLPLYVFVPVGSVIALVWLRRRIGSRFANTLAVLMVANAAIWGVTKAPDAVALYLRVSPAQAAAIRRIQAIIPPNSGVVVSEGICGAFARHERIATFDLAPTRLPIWSPYTWFVVAPSAGYESASPAQSWRLIRILRHDPAARLEYVRAGIWAFRVHGTRGNAPRYLTVPGKAAAPSARA